MLQISLIFIHMSIRALIRNSLLKILTETDSELDNFSIDDDWYLYKNGKRIYSSTSKGDLINYLTHYHPELLDKFNLSNQVNKPLAGMITLYRGVGYNEGNNFYSPSKEFALEFTRTGRESELLKMKVNSNRIYRHNPLPRGYGLEDINFDLAIAEAKRLNLNAIWVDEGVNQPESVFVINPSKKV